MAKNKEIPNWLTKIQTKSWEPEILISGIVLFALFQLPPQLTEFREYLVKFSYPIFTNGSVDETLTNSMKIGIYWLILGFSAHLFLRTIWVAFIGLSYVYPKGIDFKKVRYHSLYLKKIKDELYFINQITKLEKLCSTMFALSFLLFMIIFGFFTFFSAITILLLAIIKLNPESLQLGYIDRLFGIFTLLYVFDFISLGLLKRIPIVSKIYYPFYKILSFFTLSFLYRNVLFHFISKHRRWKVFLFVFGFTIISITAELSLRNNYRMLDDIKIANLRAGTNTLSNNHYANSSTSRVIDKIQINNDVINDGFLKAFIVHSSSNETFLMKDSCSISGNYYELTASLADSLKYQCLNEFYALQVDDSLYTSDYFFTRHPKTDQPGLMAYLNVSYLNRGMHKLILQYRNLTETADSLPYLNHQTVKFYKK